MKQISVLLLEESPFFRPAVSSVLRRLGFSVSTTNLNQLKDRTSKKPDVIVLDVVTIAAEETAKLQDLVRDYSRIAPILMLAREDRIEHVILGLRGGALGFVRQTAEPREVRNAVLAIAQGNTWCCRKLLREVTKYLLDPLPLNRARLTRREVEVMKCLAAGQTNKEIAQCLGLSVQSIKVYVSNLLHKTGASNRASVALYAAARSSQTGAE